MAAPGIACAGERDLVRAISPATTRSGRRTFPWPGRRPVGSRGAFAGHRLIRRNVSFGKAEPSPNQCIRCAVPLDQREGACDAVRAGWRRDVFRHCSKNEPRLRRDTSVRPSKRRPFASEACDQARAALPVPFAALADRTPKRIRPAGGRPAGRLSICPGQGAYKQSCLDCVSTVAGRQIPPRVLRDGFGCGRRDVEQEVGTSTF